MQPDLSVIRASRAGSCPRQLYYEAWGFDGLPPWEGMKRAFAEGNLHEDSILEWACENIPGGPWLLTNQQKELMIDGWLPGHIDGLASNIGRTILLEAKCLARRAFQELRENGVQDAQPQYYTQMQLYLYGLNECGFTVPAAYIVARNKETPRTRIWDHHYERVPVNLPYGARVASDMKRLIQQIQNKEEPPAAYHPDQDWNCRPPWCPYTYHCYPDYEKDVPEVTNKDELKLIVEEYMGLDEDIKELSKRRDELKAQIGSMAKQGDFRAGRWRIGYTERRRESFDGRTAREVLPVETLSKLLKVTTYQQLSIKEG